MAITRRSGKAHNPTSVGDAALIDGLLQQYANLADFLLRTAWDDGSPRTTGTIMLFVEAGCFKAWVHDRDAYVSAFATAGTLSDLLGAVDRLVSGDGGDWRADKKSPVRR